MQLLNDVKVPNDKLINFKPEDPGASDHQPAYRERADDSCPKRTGSDAHGGTRPTHRDRGCPRRWVQVLASSWLSAAGVEPHYCNGV